MKLLSLLRFSPWEIAVKRALKPILFIVAVGYMLVDALFMAVAKPVANWIGRHRILDGATKWIVSLRPYPTLALFAVPVLLLEPVKPAAAYLAATDHVALGITVLIVGELLKLIFLQRLFTISRKKLMSIYAFAWAYDKYHLAKAWLEATEAWQAVRQGNKRVRLSLRRFVMELKEPHSGRHFPQLR